MPVWLVAAVMGLLIGVRHGFTVAEELPMAESFALRYALRLEARKVLAPGKGEPIR